MWVRKLFYKEKVYIYMFNMPDPIILDSGKMETSPKKSSRDSEQTTPSVTVKEEDEVIMENISYMSEFLNLVQSKKGDLSGNTKTELMKLKGQFDGIFKKLRKDGHDDSQLMKARALGAIPKRKVESKVAPKAGSDGVLPKWKEKTAVISRTECERNNLSESDYSDGSEVESVSNDGSVSLESGSSDTSSNRSPVKTKTIVHRKQPAPTEPISQRESEFAMMMRAMSRMDMRNAPTMETYNDESGICLKYYLQAFEVYCRENFRGLPRFWIGELEAKLSGDALKAFHSVRSMDDTWESLVKKLSRWYDNVKVARKNKYRLRFNQAKHVKGESLYLLATRLEKLFRVAYPKKSVKYSQTLRDRFVSVVPSKFRGEIKSQILNRRMKRRKVSWESIIKVASLCDVEDKHPDSNDDEIIINIGTPKTQKKKKVMTKQHCEPTYELQEEESCEVDNNFVNYGDQNSLQVARLQKPFSGQFRRPPQSLVANNKKCFYCDRIGHVISECRFRSGSCFACGSQEHFIMECPHRSQLKSQRLNNMPSSRGRNVEPREWARAQPFVPQSVSANNSASSFVDGALESSHVFHNNDGQGLPQREPRVEQRRRQLSGNGTALVQ